MASQEGVGRALSRQQTPMQSLRQELNGHMEKLISITEQNHEALMQTASAIRRIADNQFGGDDREGRDRSIATVSVLCLMFASAECGDSGFWRRKVSNSAC